MRSVPTKAPIAATLLMLGLPVTPVLTHATQVPESRTINTSTGQRNDIPKSWIGVKGALAFFVREVHPNSSAERAGLRKGDALVSLDGEDVTSAESFLGRIWQSVPGTPFRINYLRYAPTKQVWDEHGVTVETMAAQTGPAPSDAPKSWIGAKGVLAFFVKSVHPGSPAEKAGFQPGDVLVSLNDEDVTSVDSFMGRIWQSDPGTSFRIKYLRYSPARQLWDENSVAVQTMAAQTAAGL